jgi:hypothetical protein
VKLPYRLGDSFALPLGNGQFARSSIVQCEHRVVVIRVAIGEESLDLRVSDDALVLHRWKRDGRVNLSNIGAPRPQNVNWMHAARAERIAAAASGAPHPRERRISVREVRDDNAADALAALDDDSILSLTERVSAPTLERIVTALFNHPGITLRLHGGASEQLDAFAASPLARLTLAGGASRLPALPSVRHLDLAIAYDSREVAASFPQIESLRLGARDSVVRLSDFHELAGLRSLDLSAVRLADERHFQGLPQLTTLRLNRVSGVRTMKAIHELPLRTLTVEHLHELESVDALSHLRSLEQLQLIGLWQFDIAHVAWALERERLLRAEIDIGGRRKNVELYRRASWAYPWRFA